MFWKRAAEKLYTSDDIQKFIHGPHVHLPTGPTSPPQLARTTDSQVHPKFSFNSYNFPGWETGRQASWNPVGWFDAQPPPQS